MNKKDPGYLRFAFVGLCRLYLGVNNVRKAFRLAPFSQWAAINWMLAVVGAVLIAIVIPCIYMSNKLLKEKKAADVEESARLIEKKRSEYTYDREEFK